MEGLRLPPLMLPSVVLSALCALSLLLLRRLWLALSEKAEEGERAVLAEEGRCRGTKDSALAGPWWQRCLRDSWECCELWLIDW